MAGKYLGAEFDIHGGGLDLRFPHHENELAQSAAAGRPFARFWMHNALVTTAGEKMSKSMGNGALVSEVTKTYPARAVRLYLAAPHYRSIIEFSPDSLAEATASLTRIDTFLDRAEEVLGDERPTADVPEAFRTAMDDDLGTPAAMATLYQAIREGNQAIDRNDRAALAETYAGVRAMLAVFGLDRDDPAWAATGTGSDDLTEVVDGLVGALLTQRQEARARKDYAAADAIRDSLAAVGLQVTDTPSGPRWSLEKTQSREH